MKREEKSKDKDSEKPKFEPIRVAEDDEDEDDYIKWVKTHIMSVEEVKKVGKDEYEVTIS